MPTSFSNVSQALRWAQATLASAPHAEPLDAPLLLAHVLGVERAALIAHPERPISEGEAAAFRALVARRAAGEPLPYLTGTRAFFDRELRVTPAVLIPRPETEHLVEAALEWAAARSSLRVVDVGTGSGALAIVLAAHLPDAAVWAVDVSPEALAVARENAALYHVAHRIRFVQGDLLQPLVNAGTVADLIAANLPYIPTPELDALDVSRYEPRLALDGGADGLDLIRRLLAQAPAVLAPDGLLLLEIAAEQGARVRELAQAALPEAQVHMLHDYAGHDRVVSIKRGR